MSYTPPTGNALDIVFTTGGYTPAAGNALSLEFSGSPFVLEQLHATDAINCTVSYTGITQTDSGTATDGSTAIVACVQVEAGSASDASNGIAGPTVVEALTASASQNATNNEAFQVDAGTASDASSTTYRTPAFITELAPATEFLVAGFGQSDGVSETVTASDAQNRTWGCGAGVTEVGTANEASDRGLIALAHEIETDLWASDSPSAVNVTAASITEVGAASVNSLSNRQWEDWAQLNATDSQSITVHLGASQDEVGTADDAPIAINFTREQLSPELLAATDTPDGIRATFADQAEAATAADAMDSSVTMRIPNTVVYKLSLAADNQIRNASTVWASNTIFVSQSFRASGVISHSIRGKVRAGNTCPYSINTRVKAGSQAKYDILTYVPVRTSQKLYYGMPATPAAIVVQPTALVPSIVPSGASQNQFATIPNDPLQEIPYIYPIIPPMIGTVGSVPFVIK